MNLPKKDKNGVGRLSYSQISLFKRDKKEFRSISILSLSNLSSKVGKLFEGRHKRLKSEFSVLRLNLF